MHARKQATYMQIFSVNTAALQILSWLNPRVQNLQFCKVAGPTVKLHADFPLLEGVFCTPNPGDVERSTVVPKVLLSGTLENLIKAVDFLLRKAHRPIKFIVTPENS